MIQKFIYRLYILYTFTAVFFIFHRFLSFSLFFHFYWKYKFMYEYLYKTTKISFLNSYTFLLFIYLFILTVALLPLLLLRCWRWWSWRKMMTMTRLCWAGAAAGDEVRLPKIFILKERNMKKLYITLWVEHKSVCWVVYMVEMKRRKIDDVGWWWRNA